jgi:hypothetical protein
MVKKKKNLFLVTTAMLAVGNNFEMGLYRPFYLVQQFQRRFSTVSLCKNQLNLHVFVKTHYVSAKPVTYVILLIKM